jgi:hypothetical protein
MDSLKKEHLGDGWEKERDMDGILIGEVQRWLPLQGSKAACVKGLKGGGNSRPHW